MRTIIFTQMIDCKFAFIPYKYYFRCGKEAKISKYNFCWDMFRSTLANMPRQSGQKYYSVKIATRNPWKHFVKMIKICTKQEEKVEHTSSWYIRNRSFTTCSVSSARVISFDAQCAGGKSGAIDISGLPFSPLMLISAILKFPPHWLQILLPRHFSSSISSLSFRLTTRSISVTPSSIS